MIKVQYMSDLHVEFGGDIPAVDKDADVVVLAGDCMVWEEDGSWLEHVAEQWRGKTILYVLGNHEYYGFGTMHDIRKDIARQCLEHGIYLLDPGTFQYHDVVFVGATLWTDFELYGPHRSLGSQIVASRRMNDFREINLLVRESGSEEQVRPLSPAVTVAMHREQLEYIEAELEKAGDCKKVVITHHLPTDLSLNPDYEGDPTNPAFATDLEYVMKEWKPQFWVHGHIHHTVDVQVWGTKVLANPRGIRGDNEKFNPSAHFYV